MSVYPEFAQVRAAVGGLKGVFTPKSGGGEFFKCQHSDCSTGGRVVAETGYINLKLGLSEEKPEWGPSPAYEHLLKLAGLWQPQESSTPPASPPPTPTQSNPVGTDGVALEREDEELILNCMDVIRAEQMASVSLLQRRLRLGYARAARVMDELERRGVVGPANMEPRAIFLDARFNPVAFKKSGPGAPLGLGSGVSGPGIEDWGLPNPVMPEGISFDDLPPLGGVPGAVAAPSDGGAVPTPEVDFVGGIKTGGAVPGPGETPTIAPMTPPVVHSNEADGLQVAQSAAVPPAVAGGGDGVTLLEAASVAKKIVALFEGAGAEKAKPKDQNLAEGMAALRWFYGQLTPTSCEMRPVLPGGGRVPEVLTAALVRKLEWEPVSLLEKRGLTPETCAKLGFRANPRSNEEILQAMRGEFDWQELAASGLWLPADQKRRLDRRPNPQFCGKGQVGRKEDNDRRNPEDKWHWGWSQPVLIPYFDEAGDLVKLRPHKGGAGADTAAGSARVYVPRLGPGSGVPGPGGEGVDEKFFTAVVCEGEYKAAALWQEVGAGAFLNYGDNREAFGVCALPGISFARNKHYRADLEDWLILVGCRRVIVSFDDEENSHKPMDRRFAAKIYMRYLAQFLKEEKHLRGLYAPLPVEWRNASGKADWDGALVKILTAE